MFDLLLPAILAITGLLAGWLKCFSNGKPTQAGWLMICIITVLTVSSTLTSKHQQKKAKLEKETLSNQISEILSANKDLESINKALRAQVGQSNAYLSDLRAQVTAIGDEKKTKMKGLIREVSAVSLEINRYYKSPSPMELSTPSGGQETLLPCCNRVLIMNGNTPFRVVNPIERNGILQYLIEFNVKNSNSDFSAGWQVRVLDPRQLSSIGIQDATYDEFIASGE